MGLNFCLKVGLVDRAGLAALDAVARGDDGATGGALHLGVVLSIVFSPGDRAGLALLDAIIVGCGDAANAALGVLGLGSHKGGGKAGEVENGKELHVNSGGFDVE